MRPKTLMLAVVLAALSSSVFTVPPPTPGPDPSSSKSRRQEKLERHRAKRAAKAALKGQRK